jgi:hypothetical protein
VSGELHSVSSDYIWSNDVSGELHALVSVTISSFYCYNFYCQI